jgi:hypothetical protein
MAVPAVVWEPGTRAGRAELGKLLEALAVAAGGVAWDCRGELCIVVPAVFAWAVAQAVDSVMPLAMGGRLAATPEQRAYEIEGPEYWAAQVRGRNSLQARGGASWLLPGWSTTCETADRAGDVLEDGTKTPATRYTRLTWQRTGEDPVEVGAPWEPAELYPRPEPAATEPPPASVETPQLPDHVLESERYQAEREGRVS